MRLFQISATGDARPQQFQLFVDNMRQAIEDKGLQWDIPMDDKGKPIEGRDWDLRMLNGSPERHAPGTVGFGIDNEVRKLAISAELPMARLPVGSILSEAAQDFIKAIIATRCLSGRTADNAQTIAKAARRLFSCTTTPPYKVSREHFETLLSLKPWSDKAKRDFFSVADVIDKNLLSEHCPVKPSIESKSKTRLLPDLNARANERKLPDKDALFELTRIVFQEVPTTFNDSVFFSILRLLILTGLRITEIYTLPVECLAWENHIDIVTGKNVGDIGGVGRSLKLRYYAEKQRGGACDILIEKFYHVPSRFEGLIETTVIETLRATAPLREILERQSYAKNNHPDSDLRTFKTSSGRVVGTWQRLFLTTGAVLKLPLSEPLTPDTAISTPLPARIYTALGRTLGSGSISFFKKYGSPPEAKNLSIQPHSLRHLMNTELFRLNVADTVITHQFGRVSVAQSYEYDHRSLAEKLKFVQLPSTSCPHIPPGSTQELVAKMVVSGVAATSHLGKSFKRIQAEHGDAAAFAYLAANSDGFHVTPYGFCTNSFSINPCTRHLRCFDRCKHFAASGLPEHRETLLDLRERLVVMQHAAVSKPSRTIGRINQITHAVRLIEGVQAALDAQPQQNIFAEGVDYAALNEKDVFS